MLPLTRAEFSVVVCHVCPSLRVVCKFVILGRISTINLNTVATKVTAIVEVYVYFSIYLSVPSQASR